MKPQSMLILTLMMAGLTSAAALAAELTPKAQYEAEKKEAATRYAEDRKLCAEETTSSARLQCLRDAKAEYNKALAAAKANLAAPAQPSKSVAVCAECGKVIAVNVGEKEGEGGLVGLIGGGAAGALLGRQVGKGTGRDIATIAGAAGGAYAGREIEQKMRTTKFWTVTIRFDNGTERTFNFDHDPGFAIGDLVKSSGDSVVRR